MGGHKHDASPLQKTLYGANVIIFEGIMAFADKTLLEVRAGLWPRCPAGPLQRASSKQAPLLQPVPRVRSLGVG